MRFRCDNAAAAPAAHAGAYSTPHKAGSPRGKHGVAKTAAAVPTTSDALKSIACDDEVEEWFTPEGGLSPQCFRTAQQHYRCRPDSVAQFLRRPLQRATDITGPPLSSHVLGQIDSNLLRDHKHAHNATYSRLLLLRESGDCVPGATATPRFRAANFRQ